MFRIIAPWSNRPVVLPPTKVDGDWSIYDLDSVDRSEVEKAETPWLRGT